MKNGDYYVAWKTERWLQDVFPGKENIYSSYQNLSNRELTIVSAAVLDAALAELLFIRLGGPEKERESFLGVNGDGRAPGASFGARIQIALLLNIIEPDDAVILRCIKAIRNHFAHRSSPSFTDQDVCAKTLSMLNTWSEKLNGLHERGHLEGTIMDSGKLDKVRPHLNTVEEAGSGLLLALFAQYQALFHLMHDRLLPVGYPFKKDSGAV